MYLENTENGLAKIEGTIDQLLNYFTLNNIIRCDNLSGSTFFPLKKIVLHEKFSKILKAQICGHKYQASTKKGKLIFKC